MPKEHPHPTMATAKDLYAHAFGCAFEGCRRTLFRLDSETGVRTLSSRICHINARREGGPRWDPSQDTEANRSSANLVLMCIEHADEIDNPALVSKYPAELLRIWKSKQLADYYRVQQGWALDDAMAEQVLTASKNPAEIAITDSTVSLGGEGGRAPGAGGGGGGAIGRNSRGGRGGDGGRRNVYDGEYALPVDDIEPELDSLVSDDNLIPGAGAGGIGAIGDGAVGGDGGDGGDSLVAEIDVDALRKRGFHHFEIEVGKGGEFGFDGGPTRLNAVTEDGTMLEKFHVKGGRAGGFSLPEGVADFSAEDIRMSGFRITTLMTTNTLDYREGVFFLLGADWTFYPATALPVDASWQFIISARWRPGHWNGPRGVRISLCRPDGREGHHKPLIIPEELHSGCSVKWWPSFQFRLDEAGTWLVRVQTHELVLAEIPIDVPAPTLAG